MEIFILNIIKQKKNLFFLGNVTVKVICRAYAKNFPSGSISTEFPLYVGGYVKKEQ